MKRPKSHHLAEYHLSARALMAQDRYVDAVVVLREGLTGALETDLYALIDLASCYYMLADYVSFRKISKQALVEYESRQSGLTPADRAPIALGLGRLLEELGLVAEALSLYDFPADFVESSRHKKLLAQQLRLKSELGLLEDARLAYLSCQQMLRKDGDQEVDFLNALLSAEQMLFGTRASLDRYAKIHASSRIRPSDRRLLFFNLLYLLLREEGEVAPQAISYLKSFDYFECDPFERGLYDVALTLQGATPLEELKLERSARLSPMCAIRFISLVAKADPRILPFHARREFTAYSDLLTPGSKRMIHEAFPLPDTRLMLHVTEDRLSYEDVEIDLARRPNALKLLQLFSEKQAVTLEEICQTVYGCELDPNSQHRARMAISRLNKALSSKLGFTSLFQMGKIDVRLDERVRIAGQAS